MNTLFTPYKIKNLQIKNRIVVPPMVCFTFSNEEGYVTDKNIRHYETIAKGGAGLIIVEATCVTQNGKLSEDQLGIWSDSFVEGLSKIASVCHQQGAKVFIQLHHAGLKVPKSVNEDLITSFNYNDGKVSARTMSIEEIHEVQKDFTQGAIRAEQAGFDGVELHGAHSYLITQFLSSKVNKRTDEYGGNFKNRLRFVTEIAEEIKKRVNPEFVLGIRMGCNEDSLKNSIETAKEFQRIGMDYLHVSTGFDGQIIEEPVPGDFMGNWIVYGASKIKKEVKIPVIAVNSIKTKEQAEYLISNDFADFVAIGRAQLADHYFVKHAEAGEEIITCLSCKPCRWFKNPKDCPRHSN